MNGGIAQRKIHLEKQCVNRRCFEVGGNEFANEQCIDTHIQDNLRIPTCLPLSSIKCHFDELEYGDHPEIVISEDAGTYLCNYI